MNDQQPTQTEEQKNFRVRLGKWHIKLRIIDIVAISLIAIFLFSFSLFPEFFTRLLPGVHAIFVLLLPAMFVLLTIMHLIQKKKSGSLPGNLNASKAQGTTLQGVGVMLMIFAILAGLFLLPLVGLGGLAFILFWFLPGLFLYVVWKK